MLVLELFNFLGGVYMKRYTPDPLFYSVHHKANKIVATEKEIDAIYDAAFKGLKDDALAVAAGFLPKDFVILCQSDPLAELAVIQGRADNHILVSDALLQKALGGDTKAAMGILTHLHGWKPAKPENDDNNITVTIKGDLPDPPLDD